MKSASIAELKSTLKTKSAAELLDLCLRLARAKKDTKELLSFLLYEAYDLPAYIENVKKDIDAELASVNTGNMHWAKKSLRKMLRLINKHIRFTGSKSAEAELRLYFCAQLTNSKIQFTKSAALLKLYNGQLQKIETAIAALHEDLQRDYTLQLEALQ